MSLDGHRSGCRYASDLAAFVVKPGTTSVVVCVTGEIDISNATWLAAKLRAVIDGGEAGQRASRVVVDLSELRFLDAQGLAALVESQRFAESLGTQLELTRPSDMIRKLLSITQLEATLLVAED